MHAKRVPVVRPDSREPAVVRGVSLRRPLEVRSHVAGRPGDAGGAA